MNFIYVKHAAAHFCLIVKLNKFCNQPLNQSQLHHTALEFHTMHFLYRHFALCPFAATCYGTRQLNVDSFGVQAMDHVVVWVLGCCRVSGHLAGGVPGFLTGSALFFVFAVAAHP